MTCALIRLSRTCAIVQQTKSSRGRIRNGRASESIWAISVGAGSDFAIATSSAESVIASQRAKAIIISLTIGNATGSVEHAGPVIAYQQFNFTAISNGSA